MTRTPVVHLLAGPNGSGKSTYVEKVLAPSTHLPFINADVIAAIRWPTDAQAHAYDAATLAAQERDKALSERTSFITETVFSHPSKVDLVDRATALGYHVHLHVVLVPEAVTVGRVAFRVGRGGHTVPEHKIRERYHRLWPLVVRAREVAERTQFYDNSRIDPAFRLVATYRRGSLIGAAAWPAWAPPELTE